MESSDKLTMTRISSRIAKVISPVVILNDWNTWNR